MTSHHRLRVIIDYESSSMTSHHRSSLMKLRGARRLQLLFAIAWGSLGQENSVTEAPDQTFLGGWSGGVPRGSCTTPGSMRRVIFIGQRSHTALHSSGV
jgi:hypothetical protein